MFSLGFSLHDHDIKHVPGLEDDFSLRFQRKSQNKYHKASCLYVALQSKDQLYVGDRCY